VTQKILQTESQDILKTSFSFIVIETQMTVVVKFLIKSQTMPQSSAHLGNRVGPRFRREQERSLLREFLFGTCGQTPVSMR